MTSSRRKGGGVIFTNIPDPVLFMLPFPAWAAVAFFRNTRPYLGLLIHLSLWVVLVVAVIAQTDLVNPQRGLEY